MKSLMQGDQGVKWCPGCKDFLDPDLFHKDVRRPDGMQVYCKKCRNAKYYQTVNTPNPEMIVFVKTEYPSRGSVPEAQRAQYDVWVRAGMAIVVVTPRKKRIKWEDILD